jgi:hypothetical protein
MFSFILRLISQRAAAYFADGLLRRQEGQGNETCTIEFCAIGDGEKGAEGCFPCHFGARLWTERDPELSRETAGCPGDWLLISRLAGPFFEPAAVAAL